MTQVIAWDHAAFLAVNGWQGNPLADFLFRYGTELGSAYVALPLGVLLVRMSKSRGGWPMIWRAIITVSVVTLSTTSLKLLFARPRPLATLEGVRVLGPPLYQLSFPSGHTITAFAMAALFLTLDLSVGLAWLVVAVFVGVSRIYVGAHFPSDVLGGAVLGFVPTWFLSRYLLRKHVV